MDKKLLMMALLMTTGLATQAQERLTQYQVRNAITVRTPIMNDSINPKGEKHTAKALLQTPVMLDLANAPTQMLSADTAGLVTFAKTDKDNLLYLLKTQLRAERFMKGKLKVTSPVGAFHQRRIENGERCCGRQYLQSSNQRNCPTPGTGNGL